MSSITINNVSLPVMEHSGHRVVTLAEIDALHERPAGTARRNFNEHRTRLEEGVDYFRIGADEFRTRLDPAHSKFASEDVVLFTETGYTMLVKPFNDDLAWKVQRQVVNGYFAARRVLSPTTTSRDRGVAELVAREFKALACISKIAGLTGNHAVIAAAQGTERLTGTNPLALIGQTHLLCDEQVRYYTPTELGREVGVSAQKFNDRLARAGLQVKDIHGNWLPTKAGELFGVLSDTGKRKGSGTPVQQLRWLHTVIDALPPAEAA